jgi:hypothetical protein
MPPYEMCKPKRAYDSANIKCYKKGAIFGAFTREPLRELKKRLGLKRQ